MSAAECGRGACSTSHADRRLDGGTHNRAASIPFRPRAGERGLGKLAAMSPGYPAPSTLHASAVMRANPSRDTWPERRIRQLLHSARLRYRVNLSVRPDGGRPTLVDIAFTRARVAVFVDGCFWHSCPTHGTTPKANGTYWSPKLARNVERDSETTMRLELAGLDHR